MQKKSRNEKLCKDQRILKIVGTRGNYHEILSRFVLCEQLFDEILF
ncbi:hypothetical protein QM027_08705 [Campylobacter concisus]